ncbi:MAG: hypothetical protein HY763_02700 [Planctomycetes bacterium]|nr:hypothetical protein [Planctomycetota bacterium]
MKWTRRLAAGAVSGLAVGALRGAIALGVAATPDPSDQTAADDVGVVAPLPHHITSLDANGTSTRVVVQPVGPARREYGGTGREPESVSVPGGKLIYSNTRGHLAYAPGAGRTISDDLFTNAGTDCDITGYALLVSGGGFGGGPGFGVQVALYDGCPAAGGRVFPRTRATAFLPNDGLYEVVVDFSPRPTPVTPTLWLAATFSNDAAGWVLGTPAEIGYSDDLFLHPSTGCGSFFGGFPQQPHASFAARVWATDACPEAFLAYHAVRGSPLSRPAGANIVAADDLTLTVETCELARIETAARGQVGPYTMEFGLRGDGPGDPIPGASWSHVGRGDGSIEWSRRSFPPGLIVPQVLWLTWKPNVDSTGVGVAGRNQIGGSADWYAAFDTPQAPGVWSFFSVGGALRSVFQASIRCYGPAPVGACCATAASGAIEVCQDGVTPTACIGRWFPGRCEDEPAASSCGARACCLPDGGCTDLADAACRAVGGVSDSRTRCGAAQQECPPFACLTGQGACLSPGVAVPCLADAECPGGQRCAEDGLCTGRAGCCDTGCCAAVCGPPTGDSFCCEVAWDGTCASIAQAICDPPPVNDECSEPGTSGGAAEIILDASGRGSATGDANRACRSPVDPTPCCSGGPAAEGATLWYRFVTPASSARVHTCATPAPLPGQDSLLQVFAADDQGSPAAACDSLREIGCNDDGGCGPQGRLSDLCVGGLIPGETYYILLRGAAAVDRGTCLLEVESPCPQAALPRCPDGNVVWVDPPAGVVDARQPHPPANAAALQGIDRFTVFAPSAVDPAACWSVCRSDGTGGADEIERVQDNGDGTLAVVLRRPITAGTAVTLTYTSDSGCTRARGEFAALPGDVAADGTTSAQDVLSWVNRCANRTVPPPFGVYSCDVDHSAAVSASDLVRLVDLLNGAGQFDVWKDRRVSRAFPCP